MGAVEVVVEGFAAVVVFPVAVVDWFADRWKIARP